jgi:uncharacterized protein (DUF1501 family)
MSCDDCTRAQLLRAAAGQGLPAIEPGMPLPAGTGLSRRSLLLRASGLALAVYGGSTLSRRAIEDALAAGPSPQILVSLFLEGGADALSVLAPVGDPLYRKLRPRLALSGGVPFAPDPRLHWHPSLGGLQQLFAEGKVAVLPAIGYTHPDQSHFTSRHYWEVGATHADLRTGWLGRYLDRVGSLDNPLQGLSLGDGLQPALATAKVPVASVDSPGAYDFWVEHVWGEPEQRMLAALGSFAGGSDPALQAAAAVARQSSLLRGQLLPFADKEDGTPSYTSPIPYPAAEDGFPKRLAGLAAMIAAGLPLSCVALSAPGEYDTHADQAKALADGLELTSDSLLAFQRDLEARGLADRVLVHVWSEFGRRAEENGSAGTDHGAAGVGFVIGSRVRGGMIGEFPGLQKLDDDGNLVPTADFRGLYAALLEQWLGADAEAVIPGARSFARPRLVA